VVKIISRGSVSHLLDIKAIESKAAYRKRGFPQITRFSLPTANPYAYFTGMHANQTIVFSGILGGSIDGRIAYVSHFSGPSEGDALDISFPLVLGKQGGIGDYRAFTDPDVSYSVVLVPEPMAGRLILAAFASSAVRLMVTGLTHKLKTVADLTTGQLTQTARPPVSPSLWPLPMRPEWACEFP
jgi:hypothetical protein